MSINKKRVNQTDQQHQTPEKTDGHIIHRKRPGDNNITTAHRETDRSRKSSKPRRRKSVRGTSISSSTTNKQAGEENTRSMKFQAHIQNPDHGDFTKI